jgi:hypothetical protein
VSVSLSGGQPPSKDGDATENGTVGSSSCGSQDRARDRAGFLVRAASVSIPRQAIPARGALVAALRSDLPRRRGASGRARRHRAL